MSVTHAVAKVSDKLDDDNDANHGEEGATETNTASPDGPAPNKQDANDDEKRKPLDVDKLAAEAKKAQEENTGPAGGFDATPIPKVERGYTVKFTLHRATNLPIADLQALSSDPFIIAQLNTHVPTRHKEDPILRFRTNTVHKSTEPEWNEQWIVANVPRDGFRLKLRVYDEDPNDADDRLGNVAITVDSIDENWAGEKEQAHKIQPRSGSKRAYAIRGLAKCFGAKQHLHGLLYLSMEVLGRTEEDGQNGRLYTLGPCRWIQHFSPMLGRLANVKAGDSDDEDEKKEKTAGSSTTGDAQQKKKVQQYNFQANQMQLQGPIPAPMYHRFVEFKKFVKRMFTASGIGGFILSKALHHQHARVYNFSRDTVYGTFPDGPSTEMTKKFLELVHYDKGGRIFTYVLTLDALFRFTETGKEFSVDMLSKHTMHSDVSIYIAFSGEFFVRRLKNPRKPPPPQPVEKTQYGQNESYEDDNITHPPVQNVDGGGDPDSEGPKDPSYYELVIDNDSGTYRPNAKLLPLLQEFLSNSFPGLHVQVLDCQKDADKMKKMKDEQRERKKSEGDQILVMQGSRSSSFSSSDDEDFDRLQADYENPEMSTAHESNLLKQAGKDYKRKQQARWEKLKGDAKRDGHSDADAEAIADEDAKDKPETKVAAIGKAGPASSS